MLCLGYVENATIVSAFETGRDRGPRAKEIEMVGLLLLVLLLVLLFGALGVTISPLFFILLVAVLLIAGTGGRRWSRRW